MKFLLDGPTQRIKRKENHPLVAGQLLTPLTGYSNWGGAFAVDNGAFSRFNQGKFLRLLERERENAGRCLFVVMPDIVGSGRRTLEIWQRREMFNVPECFPLAFVAQDGAEDLEIPWGEFSALFIGGCDPWKDSKAACDLVKTAKTIGIHVHIGRVNQPERYDKFAALGADTCDGSGISREMGNDRQFKNIVSRLEQSSLFDQEHVLECLNCGSHEISFGTTSDPENVCVDCGCVVITSCGTENAV
jgi:hypothetical protein